MSSDNNLILLSGIPRSGTTLACSLLNQVENVVALVEPMPMDAFLARTKLDEADLYIIEYASSIRKSFMKGEPVLVKAVEGTNTFEDTKSEVGKRKSAISGSVYWDCDKVLSDDFTLVIKHPNVFAALISSLANKLKCFSIVRNPLSILASWNSLDHPLAKGNAPMAEACCFELAEHLKNYDEGLPRQIELLNWYFKQFLTYLPYPHIVCYEDIVETQGMALGVLHDGCRALHTNLKSKNVNELYSKSWMSTAAEALLSYDGAWAQLYSNQDIEILVERM